MNLVQALIDLEKNESIHLGRLLILLAEFSKGGKSEMKGITKLAKLDFLLRYPAYLEKALEARGKKLKKAELKEFEKTSVESKMVRYRYGPWDFRYRKFLNILIAKGLIYYRTEGNTIMIGMTKTGMQIAESFREDDSLDDLFERARVLRINFDIKATRLKNFIYDTFPEISSLKFGQSISYGN